MLEIELGNFKNELPNAKIFPIFENNFIFYYSGRYGRNEQDAISKINITNKSIQVTFDKKIFFVKENEVKTMLLTLSDYFDIMGVRSEHFVNMTRRHPDISDFVRTFYGWFLKLNNKINLCISDGNIFDRDDYSGYFTFDIKKDGSLGERENTFKFPPLAIEQRRITLNEELHYCGKSGKVSVYPMKFIHKQTLKIFNIKSQEKSKQNSLVIFYPSPKIIELNVLNILCTTISNDGNTVAAIGYDYDNCEKTYNLKLFILDV